MLAKLQAVSITDQRRIPCFMMKDSLFYAQGVVFFPAHFADHANIEFVGNKSA